MPALHARADALLAERRRDMGPRDSSATAEALGAGDLERLGAITEANAPAMHASAMTAHLAS